MEWSAAYVVGGILLLDCYYYIIVIFTIIIILILHRTEWVKWVGIGSLFETLVGKNLVKSSKPIHLGIHTTEIRQC